MLRIRQESFNMTAQALWRMDPKAKEAFENWQALLLDMQTNAGRLYDKTMSVQSFGYELFFIPLNDGSIAATAAIDPQCALYYVNEARASQ